MNNGELAYPQNIEASNLTNFIVAHCRWVKFVPVNMNINFALILNHP